LILSKGAISLAEAAMGLISPIRQKAATAIRLIFFNILNFS
jgi:hypothetical protein